MKTLNFIKSRKIVFIISAVLILAGIASFAIQGFNWDVDFVGGTELVYDIGHEADRAEQDKIEAAVEAAGIDVSTIQNSGDNNVIIKTKELSTEERTKVSDVIVKMYEKKDASDVLVEANNISASIGGELRRNAIIATIIAIVLMLVYIAIRFEWRSGLTAIIGLAHDVLIMLAAYTIFQIPMNTSFIAAILTIIGYSINAAIIVLDRIRENKALKTMGNEEIVNISVKQTLRRTINTTITTLLTIGMVFILGVTSIKEFALPLIVGIISGLYSSIFLTGPVWELISKKK